MKNEWKNINETTRNRLEEALNQREMNFKEYSQEWFEDGQIDEVAFCENFLQRMPLKCINGIFFSYDGMLPDSEVEKEIYRMVKPVLTKGVSKKVKQLLEVLKLEAYSEELPVKMDRIHVNNGTYFLNGDFTEKKEFCLNRLPVNYEMKETKPERWLQFLSELLEEDDIPTLQEYMSSLDTRELVAEEITSMQLEIDIRAELNVFEKKFGKRCELECLETAEKFSGDKEVILEVIENLLSNAFRYAKTKVEMEVLFTCFELQIRIKDDGVGFTVDKQKATELFYQQNVKDSLKHSGMGMYISRLYCEKHGGQLLIENEKQSGAVITAVFRRIA